MDPISALITGNALRGVLFLIAPVVVLLGIGTIGFLSLRFIKVRRIIKEKVEFLLGIKADQLTEKFDAIVKEFSSTLLLKNHWKEFDSSLVKKPDQVLTTVDAASFFNEYTLVDGPLGMEFFRHVPGILTALGIIGTFLGLIVGLEHFDRSELQRSISDLFVGVAGAFNISFLAISLSVLVTITERLITTRLYAQVQRLDEGLNRLFNRSLSEDYLHDMVERMGDQAQSLKSFSTDLAGAIKEAMLELVDRQSQSLNQANQMVAQQVSEAMRATVAPAVESLVDAVKDMQQKQSDSSHQALSDLVGQFTSTLSQTTGRQVDGLMAGMETTTKTLVSLQSEMSAFVGSVQQQMAAQRAQLEEVLGRTMTSSTDNQRKLQEEMGQFLGQAADRLEQLQKQLTAEAGTSVTRLGTELTSLVAKSSEQQQEAMNLLSGTITEHQSRMDRRMQEVVEQLQTSSGNATRALTSSVQATVNQVQESSTAAIKQTSDVISEAIRELVGQTKELAANSGRLNRDLGDRFERLAGLLEGLASQTTTATTQVNEQLGQSATRLAQLSQGIEGLLGSFEATISRTRQFVGEMGDGIGRVQAGAEAVASSAKSYADTHEATQRVLGSITLQSKVAEDRLAEFSRVVEQLRQHNDGLKTMLERHSSDLSDVRGDTETFFGEVRQQVREYALAVKTATEQYHDLVSGKMNKFLGEVDTQLATAVTSLHTTVTDLDDTLGALLDVGNNGGRPNGTRK